MSLSLTWVALLRAINVGGRNKVPMAALREAYLKAGCDRVASYIQSGNVVLRSEETDPARLAPLLEEAVRQASGVESPVVLRTAAEWTEAIGANPFVDLDPAGLHVKFLAGVPEPAALAALEAVDSGPDRLRVVGRDVYWYLPDGVIAARAAGKAAELRLGTGTMRNWRTVLRIADLIVETG